MTTQRMLAAKAEESRRLQELYEVQRDQLDNVVSTDLTTIKEDAASLRELAAGLKATFRSYEKDSRAFSWHLAETKSDRESQEIRDLRRGHFQDIREIVISINNMLFDLGVDNVSSFEDGSVSSIVNSWNDEATPKKYPSEFIPTGFSVPGAVGGIKNNVSLIDDKTNVNMYGKRVGFTGDSLPEQKLCLPASFKKDDYRSGENFTSNFSTFPQPPCTTHARKLDHSSTIPKGSEYADNRHGYWLHEEASNSSHSGTYEPRAYQDNSSLNVSAFRAMSAHMLQQDLLRKNIDPFNGSAISFWPWVGKLQSYVKDVNLTPLQTLHLMQSNTVGVPHEVVTSYLEAVGDVSTKEMHKMWHMLERMFGTPSKIADEILQKIEKFPTISGNNVGDQLNKLFCLCKIVEYHLPRCPELGILNFGRGLIAIRAKLPVFLQNDWRKTGQNYEDNNDGMQPPFKIFAAFIENKARQLSNGNYDTIPPVGPIPSRNRVLQTAVSGGFNNGRHCAIHENGAHDTAECAYLRDLPYVKRKRKVFELRLCFVCLGKHLAKDCKQNPECVECRARHATAMHHDVYEESMRHSSHVLSSV